MGCQGGSWCCDGASCGGEGGGDGEDGLEEEGAAGAKAGGICRLQGLGRCWERSRGGAFGWGDGRGRRCGNGGGFGWRCRCAHATHGGGRGGAWRRGRGRELGELADRLPELHVRHVPIFCGRQHIDKHELCVSCTRLARVEYLDAVFSHASMQTGSCSSAPYHTHDRSSAPGPSPPAPMQNSSTISTEVTVLLSLCWGHAD
jgi:hypothetical protein